MKKQFFFIFYLSILTNVTIHAQLPNYVPTNGLSGWWPFDGNANDESGNGNDGIPNGPDLTEDRFGQPLKAYLFQSDNHDEISVDNSESLNITGNITISCWYKNQNNSSVSALIGMGGPFESSGYNLIANSFNTYDNNSGIWGESLVASPAFGRQNILIGENRAVIPQQYVNLNEWNFICCTYDGNTMKMYLNGIMSDSINCSFELPSLTEPLLFGKERNYSPNERYFNGVLDDIGIWNRALTDDEVSKLYSESSFETITTTTDGHMVNNFNIFPNPTTDIINIDFKDLNKLRGGKVRITSMSGQIVYEENITQNKMTLSVADRLSKGIYIITTTDSGGNVLSNDKLIVQ